MNDEIHREALDLDKLKYDRHFLQGTTLKCYSQNEHCLFWITFTLFPMDI